MEELIVRVIYGSGNRIEVGLSNRFDDRPHAVRLSVPDGTELSPDSARSTAVALIEHAAHAERRNYHRAAS